ncbi:phage portal protein [Comamonas sp. lk]|uniref:anti-CBASS protein Acb1 family protein n=1 Tax=Comamonas sp. lk TaxID=2201272 RepID=UPI000EB33D6C|nr:anti-CBASS Acb1 family protein [Comamonas sp. lk]
MPEITTNSLELSRARHEFLGSLGLDAKRATAWIQYGYSEQVSFEMLYAAYERGGAGHGAVHRLLDVCWLKLPRIKKPDSDEKSPWEVKAGKVLRSIRAWSKFKDLDRRNLVGRYAAVIYRVADSKTLDQPLERATKLVDLIPLYENQIKVTKWHTEQGAENYGTPAMFQYRKISPPGTETEGRPEEWADVHPSRVQILAEGAVGDFYDGVPLLRAGFNRLVDLDKIAGGSGESFLKNSARTIVFKYEAGATPQAIPGPDGAETKSVRAAHEEQARALNRSTDAAVVMQGGDATTLQTSISDPTGPWTTAANEFAASVRIPFTVLFGQQTGRLASDEDKSDFANRCSSRQEFELTPMLEEFITRMQAAGIIDAGEFEIEWPPVNAPTEKDKAELLGKMTAAMQQAFQAGLTEPLFDANELRAVMDFEQRKDDGMPTEDDPARADQVDPADERLDNAPANS